MGKKVKKEGLVYETDICKFEQYETIRSFAKNIFADCNIERTTPMSYVYTINFFQKHNLKYITKVLSILDLSTTLHLPLCYLTYIASSPLLSNGKVVLALLQ